MINNSIDRILVRMGNQPLVITVVFTITVSVILYFANSKEFHLVKNVDQIKYPNYTIIPPEEHLVQSGEDYPIHIMVKTPLRGLKATAVPVTILIVHCLTALYAKKRKGEPVKAIVTTPVD